LLKIKAFCISSLQQKRITLDGQIEEGIQASHSTGLTYTYALNNIQYLTMQPLTLHSLKSSKG